MSLLIFVVEDDADYRQLIDIHLSGRSTVRVASFESGIAALERLDDGPDLILLDVLMPEVDGLETLRQIKARNPQTPVVMLSARSSMEIALAAIKLGALDYLIKGQDDFVKMDIIIGHIEERIQLRKQISLLQEEIRPGRGFEQLIGESPAMSDLYRSIKRALRGNMTVAIFGESGTGKELVAQAIHNNSDRRARPFVIVNCAAIPSELMESEIFGHEKGSFTGASSRRIGKFEQADGGTIFLDEIGEMDLGLQAKLLRILQDRKLERIGSSETFQVDVRVITATNRDIQEMVRAGTFREDLYYRLFEFPIFVPPLRARENDVALLADHFMRQFVGRYPEMRIKKLAPEAQRALLQYGWPGNVRELKSVIERSVLMTDGDHLGPSDMIFAPPLGRSTPTDGTVEPAIVPERSMSEAPKPTDLTPSAVLRSARSPREIMPLEDLKRIAVEHAYTICNGNIDRTARCLGVTRSTIYRLLRKFDIEAQPEEAG